MGTTLSVTQLVALKQLRMPYLVLGPSETAVKTNMLARAPEQNIGPQPEMRLSLETIRG